MLAVRILSRRVFQSRRSTVTAVSSLSPACLGGEDAQEDAGRPGHDTGRRSRVFHRGTCEPRRIVCTGPLKY